jgi:hypothetical protein
LRTGRLQAGDRGARLSRNDTTISGTEAPQTMNGSMRVHTNDDISQALRTAWLATAGGLTAAGGNPDYATGFEAALVVVAAAFGIDREWLNWRSRVMWERNHARD